MVRVEPFPVVVNEIDAAGLSCIFIVILRLGASERTRAPVQSTLPTWVFLDTARCIPRCNSILHSDTYFLHPIVDEHGFISLIYMLAVTQRALDLTTENEFSGLGLVEATVRRNQTVQRRDPQARDFIMIWS
jgi:hypothetical protein